MAEKIGRYEIKEEVGRGGMATVYRAYDPLFERDVAVKVLPRAMLHDPQFRIRFEREAKMIAMLEHPAIVPVYDYGEEDGQPYFVMRYMTGGSLADRIKQGPLTVAEATRILAHIGPALDEAHRRGVIHRDLKPGNILFDQHGMPYISDFGIAKLAGAQTNVTGSAIVGTPAYLCPEQAQGEELDGRADIYALGVILFEMLTGRQPYEGDTPMSVVVKHITQPPPHILDVRPDLPPAIEAIIEKAMAKRKEERYATVAEMVEALQRLAVVDATLVGGVARPAEPTVRVAERTRPARGQVATPSSPPVVSAPRPRRRWPGVALFLAACLLLTGGLYLARARLQELASLAGLIPLSTPLPATATEQVTPLLATTTMMPVATATATATPPLPTDTPTPSPSPTLTPAPTTLPVIGGADLIAFVGDNEIWTMGVDGRLEKQWTADGAIKHDLQWSPDGKSLFYISGKCIYEVVFSTGEVHPLTCFVVADFLEAFEIAPDGQQVAISLNRELYVVPFDRERLAKARSRIDLAAMKGCYTYTDLGVKGVRWSRDGRKVALLVEAMGKARREDAIRVIDISACDSTKKFALDTFPAARFTMSGYNERPLIPSYDWDGEFLFLLNSDIRNNGFGFLYVYNLDTKTATLLDPVGTRCCYRDARWSPDGRAVIFAYQDINLGANSVTQLYYIDYGIIGSGAKIQPLPLPGDFFTNPREKPMPVLRPAP